MSVIEATCSIHISPCVRRGRGSMSPGGTNVETLAALSDCRACAAGSAVAFSPEIHRLSRPSHAAARRQLFPPSPRVRRDRRDADDRCARAPPRNTPRSCRLSMSIRWCARRSSSIACWRRSRNRPASCSTRCSMTSWCSRLEKHCRELEPALPVDPGAGAAAAAILSRDRDLAPGRRAAHAQCGVFQAHRCAQLHHAARRRPASSTVLRKPMSCSSGCRARRRPRPRSISPTAA